MINNLALSSALDGKATEAETLLKKASADGHDDKRIRQNLALVLGLQGKFDEARQVVSVDMTEAQAKTSMSYLRNMLTKPTQLATAQPARSPQPNAEDWSPFASNDPETNDAPVQTASNAPSPTPVQPKVQMVKPVDEVEPPAKLLRTDSQ